LEQGLQNSAGMTTIGQLVSILFAKYERQFHDEKLAALATQVALDELLRERKPSNRPAH
jgi:hypothetical protein